MEAKAPVAVSIDAYIADCPEPVRTRLHALRDLIKNAVPEATEKISWGMPTFFLHGNLVHFAAFKNHVGFFPGSEAVAAFRAELDGFTASVGTIRLPYAQPLPTELILNIVSYCVGANKARAAGKRKTK